MRHARAMSSLSRLPQVKSTAASCLKVPCIPLFHAPPEPIHAPVSFSRPFTFPFSPASLRIGRPLGSKLTSHLLSTAEDNMNVQLKDITVTARDGRVSHLDQVYIRGSHVRFFIVPDMLRNAPMFRSRGVRGRGVGLARGRATVNRARAGRRG